MSSSLKPTGRPLLVTHLPPEKWALWRRIQAWRLPQIDQSPDAMTKRARQYMAVVAARHLVLAGFILIQPPRFRGASFVPMLAAMPLWGWGLMLAVVGALAAYAGIYRREAPARVALIASSSLSGVIAFGLTIAAVSTPNAGITGVVVFWALTLKDLIVCQDPIRAPFEALRIRELSTGTE